MHVVTLVYFIFNVFFEVTIMQKTINKLSAGFLGRVEDAIFSIYELSRGSWREELARVMNHSSELIRCKEVQQELLSCYLEISDEICEEEKEELKELYKALLTIRRA